MKLLLGLHFIVFLLLVSVNESQSGALSAQATSTHPTLLFYAEDVEELREQAASTHAEIWNVIHVFTDSMIGTEPLPVPPVEGNLLFYRYSGDRLLAMAFTCVITEVESECNQAKKYLLAYAAWPQWGERNERGLGHAHMLQANALAYDWLFNILTVQEREIVRTSLIKWTQQMYEASSQGYVDQWNNWWRKSYMQNFYWTTNGAIGIASLALLNEVSEAAVWLEHAQRQLTIGTDILNNIGDGSWHESILYQSYMLSMSLPFMVNLRRITGADILPHDYFQNYIDWRVYNQLSDGSYILAYGDFDRSWLNGFGPQGLMRFMASEYDSHVAEWGAQQIILGNPRVPAVWEVPWYVYEFLYYDASVIEQPPTQQSHNRHFPDAEAVIWRTGWTADSMVFAMKSGPFGGRYAFESFIEQVSPWDPPCSSTGCQLNAEHDHNDTNTFYLFANGEWLLLEEVGPEYMDTQFHNTILIDGVGQYRPPVERFWEYPEDLVNSDGFLSLVVHTPNFSFLSSDATLRYRTVPDVRKIIRHVLFVKPKYFIIYDKLTSDLPHRYEWRAHLNGTVSVQENWLRLETGNHQFLDIMSSVVGATSNIQISDGSLQRLSVSTLEPAQDVRMVHMLHPSTELGTPPVIHNLPADERVVRIVEPGRTDFILFALENDGSTINVDMFETNGQIAFISLNNKNDVERIFFYGGEYITQTSGLTRTLVSNLNKNEPFEAIYSDEGVSVSGNIDAGVRLYAPGAGQLIVNGLNAGFERDGDYIVVINPSHTDTASQDNSTTYLYAD